MNPDRYETCAWCRTWINLRHTPYDKAIEHGTNRPLFLHHHGCARLWIENNYGEIVEEVIHHQETPA